MIMFMSILCKSLPAVLTQKYFSNKINNFSASFDITYSPPQLKALTNFALGFFEDFIACSIERACCDSNES